MKTTELKNIIASTRVPDWDQNIGLDGAEELLKELQTKGFKIVPMDAYDKIALENGQKKYHEL